MDRNNALIKLSPDVNICQVKPDSHENFSWKNFKLYDIYMYIYVVTVAVMTQTYLQ